MVVYWSSPIHLVMKQVFTTWLTESENDRLCDRAWKRSVVLRKHLRRMIDPDQRKKRNYSGRRYKNIRRRDQSLAAEEALPRVGPTERRNNGCRGIYSIKMHVLKISLDLKMADLNNKLFNSLQNYRILC